MRKTTMLSLVAAGLALAGTGASRAQDAQQVQSTATTTGSILLPVGDKVHGHLRGGETHALQVHLAKGDVYSFSVTSQKRGDMLLMHLTMLDPSGNEVNEAARVDHIANGKRVTVGPYVAPTSGTYVMQISAQSWFDGDYWGTSSVRGSRTTIVRLPSDGTTIGVDVAAGSTLHLRSKGLVGAFTMATPNAQPSQMAGSDPLVVSLRARGLASSETGTYQFGAKGAASIAVTKPQWKSAVVEVPTLPDDPTRLAQFDFVMNGWKRVPASTAQPSISTSPMASVGAPVAVSASSSSDAGTSLFLGTDVNAVTAVANFLTPAPSDSSNSAANDAAVVPPDAPVPPSDASGDPATPSDPASVTPPSASSVAAPPGMTTPLMTTSAGTPTGNAMMPQAKKPLLSTMVGSRLIGLTAFLSMGDWRDVPWTRYYGLYPSSVVAQVLPPIGNTQWTDGYVADAGSSAPQYYVDGHEVDALLATGGEATIMWSYSGSVSFNGGTWTVGGSWTMCTHVPTGDVSQVLNPTGRSSCSLTGEEHVQSGNVKETLTVSDFVLNPTAGTCDPVGQITNALSVPDAGVHQTVIHEYFPADYSKETVNGSIQFDHIALSGILVGAEPLFKLIQVTTTTIDPSTAPDAVDVEEPYYYTTD